ncbi:inositol monophosphatase family protein [Piscibacillus sp. B03]|uniref:inositol monophosphatase family protein n=1 Tax=Piscibacillus sp. B03 TaxID=3457430 RepID=UPI003FCD76D8
MDQNLIFEKAKEWTLEAGEILRTAVKEVVDVEYKTSAADLVTNKDQEIEKYFADKIKNNFSNHFLLGEEGTVQELKKYDPYNETVWVIDPIDGTTNFVHLKCNFSISVAVYHKGIPVLGIIYDPIKDEMFHTLCGQGVFVNNEVLPKPDQSVTLEQAVLSMNHLWLAPNPYLNFKPLQTLVNQIRGFRCIGSAALELAYVAAGRLDGAIFIGLGPWDYSAGLIMLKEQGYQITTVTNEQVPLFNHSSILVSHQTLHHEIYVQYMEKALS